MGISYSISSEKDLTDDLCNGKRTEGRSNAENHMEETENQGNSRSVPLLLSLSTADTCIPREGLYRVEICIDSAYRTK